MKNFPKSIPAIICIASFLLSCQFTTAAPMISIDKEMVRINSVKNRIECSRDNGRNWSVRYTGSSCGTFIDLLFYGNELFAITSKGVYYSKDKGRNWSARYTGSSCGKFHSLTDGGRELLAQTSKGLYYSKDKGRNWSKRH